MSHNQHPYDDVYAALAKASAALTANDVEFIWMDTSGGGWTQEINLFIQTGTPHGEYKYPLDMALYAQGIHKPKEGSFPIWMAQLPPEVRRAVLDALKGIDLNSYQLDWRLEAVTEKPRGGGVLVWPLRHKVLELQADIDILQAEIDRLKQIDLTATSSNNK